MKEVVSIKTDGESVECNYDVDGVWNLTQIISELKIIKLHLIKEYLDRTKKDEN